MSLRLRLIAFVAFGALLSCVNRVSGPNGPTPVSAVMVGPTSVTLAPGATQQFTATTTDATGGVLTGRTIAWTTSNSAVATVTSSGLASGVADGTATITATTEGRTATAVLTVVSPIFPVATVTVTPSTATLAPGSMQQFTATAKDAGGNTLTGRTVAWTTSNSAVATVNSATGLATGVAAGTATITATSEGQTGSTTLTITGGGGPTCSGPTLGCGLALDQFSLIPSGSFQMGSASQQPVHTVNITHSFYMQKSELTQGQWRSVMGSSPSYFSSCGDTCPVEQVSWDDIQTFITTLNSITPGVTYRLPTEAEWEYAARAGTTGDTYGTRDTIAWYVSNSGDRTHQVGGKDQNVWGLYDMIGNVWEWVQDWYGLYSADTVNDPTGPGTGTWRGLRGGSWGSSPNFSVVANRGISPPSTRSYNNGFRLVRTP